jgi:ABC-type transport system involved in cytochrome bd biosynthesis fused ATPase/permease subunit
MKYLEKVWVRILISMLIGSFLAEIIHIKKGYMPVQISNFIVLSTTIIGFSLFTLILRLRKKKEDELQKSKEEILDA